MNKLNVLVLGKGGREHALAQHLARSSLLNQLWVCPGNAGMALCGLSCVAGDSAAAVLAFCATHRVDIVVPGPEAYMVGNLKDTLQRAGVYCFAPTAHLAQLESSKLFAKDILRRAGLPTAAAQVIGNAQLGAQALAAHDFEAHGLVLKADGLAQGKGVVVTHRRADAEAAFAQLHRDFGFPILFEEQLSGPELSAFALCHGGTFRFLGTACDYKRIGPDPYSANTGGMGAYSPCDFISAADEARIKQIFEKTLRAITDQGLSYEGFLFAGLMKTATDIHVLEFNVRLGDPETQALLPRLSEDLLAAIVRARDDRLQANDAHQRAECAVHVVAASRGYPQKDMLLGQAIALPADLSAITFAGVSAQGGTLVNSGGRVLGVTALALTRAKARNQAYATLDGVSFEGMVYRRDIAA